mgnify:CR=1 FL=1
MHQSLRCFLTRKRGFSSSLMSNTHTKLMKQQLQTLSPISMIQFVRIGKEEPRLQSMTNCFPWSWHPQEENHKKTKKEKSKPKTKKCPHCLLSLLPIYFPPFSLRLLQRKKRETLALFCLFSLRQLPKGEKFPISKSAPGLREQIWLLLELLFW